MGREFNRSGGLWIRCACYPIMADAVIDRLKSTLADRYAIQQELGSGGMARVYLANDRKLGRQVALKVLRAELASSIGAERFLREIEIAAKLNHPHILPLLDSGITEEQLSDRPPCCTTQCRTSQGNRCATGLIARNNSHSRTHSRSPMR